MANEVRRVYDPFGNEVHILQESCMEDIAKVDQELYDDASSVITRPAMVYEMVEGENTTHHYFRLLGPQTNMLISAVRTGNYWETIRCVRNPSDAELSEIFKKGNQLR